MTLQTIKHIAEDTIQMLKPYCKRIEIAGSIRREKPEPKDIEIVCIADGVKLEKALVDLKFSTNIYFKKDGIKYKQFLWSGVWHDLFITDAKHWGLTFMIRTGPKEWNVRMVEYLKRHGYTMDSGRLLQANNTEVFIESESDLFNIFGCNFIEPKLRK